MTGRKKSWKKWTVEDLMEKLVVPEGQEEKAKVYVSEYLESVKEQADSAEGFTPEEFIVQCFQNGINDGELNEDTSEVEPNEEPEAIEPTEDDSDGQEIIEVSLEQVKQALKTLLTKENTLMGLLYNKHDEYNKEFFEGKLSIPVITIDKLSNRTLGNYTPDTDNLELTNHIRFNRNFIALNTEERILETLRHEMIHQYQDEILYTGDKKPKEWHNKDFKEMAKVVGIPAIGAKCYGNPAKMPEPKSYNRKFTCGCIASNGYPLTVWSTRAIFATCDICGKKLTEVQKKGKVIPVNTSHVEKEGEDAVELEMKGKGFAKFKKFKTKPEMDSWLEEAEGGAYGTMTELKKGVYQKGHNAYKADYRYWVAYNTDEIHPDTITSEEAKKEAKKVTKGKKKPEAPKEPIEKKAEEKVKVELEVTLTSEESKEMDYKTKEGMTELYKIHGSTRAIAEAVGVNQSTIVKTAKKLEVDFKALKAGVKNGSSNSK